MDRRAYEEDLLSQLGKFGFQKEEEDDGNHLVLVGNLKRADKDDNIPLIYRIVVSFDGANKRVNLDEKVSYLGQEITKESDLNNIIIETKDTRERFSLIAVRKSLERTSKNFNYPLEIKGLQPVLGVKVKTKTPAIIGIVIGIILIIIILIFGISKCVKATDKTPKKTQKPTISQSPGNNSITIEDEETYVGNIANSQFYFETEDRVYYSHFDKSGYSHIYTMEKDGSDFKSIYDGFGWNLLVYKDWLYFVGNPGKNIDNTYNMYRITLDGKTVEKLTSVYTYNLFIFNDELYYVKKAREDYDLYSLFKSDLDGKNEESFLQYAISAAPYKGSIYFVDGSGNLYKTQGDPKKFEVSANLTGKNNIFYGNKVIYVSLNGQLCSQDLDGDKKGEEVVLKDKGDLIIHERALILHNDYLYYVEYSESAFDYDIYGYPYTISRLNLKTNEINEVYESYSTGFYINIVGGKLYAFEMVRSRYEQGFTAPKVMTMSLTGQGVVELREE